MSKSKDLGMAYGMSKRKAPMSKGGKVDHALDRSIRQEDGPAVKANQKGVNKIVPNYDREHNEIKHGQSELRYGDAQQKRREHRQTLTELREMDDGNLKGLAEGGEVSMDHDSSMADAIMARRDRLHEEIDSGAHDLDSAVRMAEGGEVDIDDNAEEQPNEFYDLNEDAALKENYDSDMDDVSQPKDSNEHGHMLSDEDEHDMSDKIRKQMKARRKA